MITAPAGADNTHLQALAKLSSLLINPDVVNALKGYQHDKLEPYSLRYLQLVLLDD